MTTPLSLYASTFAARKRTAADDVYITGMIGGGWSDDDTTATSAVEALNAVECDVINVYINSPGGSVMDGYVIANHIRTLRHTGKTVHAIITGMAASIAAYITTAADTVKMHRDGIFMIHRTSAVVSGRADELRSEAETLDKLNAQITRAYLDKTGLPEEKLESLMVGATGDGTTLSAEEALELGFIDEILTYTPNKEEINMAKKAKNEAPAEVIEQITEEAAAETQEAITEEVVKNAEEVVKIEVEDPAVDPEKEELKEEIKTLKNELAEVTKLVKDLTNQLSAAQNYQVKMAPKAPAAVSQNLSTGCRNIR